MAELTPETRAALSARMRFYRELGLTEFYRRGGAEAEPNLAALASSPTNGDALIELDREDESISPRKPASNSANAAAITPSTDKAAALRILRDEIGDCTRCALHAGRNKLVFADGSPDARILFVGEGPGADEDAQGLPFVGR